MSELAAGRELDALIAEKVMGLVQCQGALHNEEFPRTFCYALPESPAQGAEVGPYSTDISVAWEVVEKLRLSVVCSEDGWYAIKPDDIEHDSRSVLTIIGRRFIADTAPLAICRAALGAVK